MKVRDGEVALTPARAPRQNEAVVARITVGELPRGTVVAVRMASGRVLGTIVSRGSVHTIPIPDEALRDGPVRLRFEVLLRGASPRQPAPEEVVGARLDFVAAVRPQ